jgi:hypothetical protein
MTTALISVLDDSVIVDMDGPAPYPFRKVVGEANTVNIFKLGCYLGKPCFETSIMVPEGPELLRVSCRFNDLPEAFLADLKFFLDGWYMVPPDWWVAGDARRIQNIAVHNDDGGFKRFAEPNESPMGD